MVVVAPPGTPRMAGIWRTTISTAIPARIPVITGVDRNSAIHPSRKAPTAISDRADQQGGEGHGQAVARAPHDATAATPVASTGAMVESAPTDRWRFVPSRA